MHRSWSHFPLLLAPSLHRVGGWGIWACCRRLFIISAPLLGLSHPCQAPPFVFWDVMPPSYPSATLGQRTLAQDFGIWQPRVPHDYLLKRIPWRSVNFLNSEKVREPTGKCAASSFLPVCREIVDCPKLVYCQKITGEVIFPSPKLGECHAHLQVLLGSWEASREKNLMPYPSFPPQRK